MALRNGVVTTAAAEGLEVRIGLSTEGQAVQVYTMRHRDGQPDIQWKSEPTFGEPLHTGMMNGPRRAENWDTSELHRAEQEKEKRRREAEAEELDIKGGRSNRGR